MTKKLPKSPMQLDLDSFLQSQSTTSDSDSDSESGLDSIHRRTVDEILNDSSSSSPSSSYSSPSTSPPRRNVQIPEPLLPSPAVLAVDQTPSPSPSPSEPKITSSFATGRKPGEFSGSVLSLGRSRSHPLPLLFGGVKPNPKPGAALAAAAAASRSIPTPYANAIKYRRASGGGLELQKGEGSADSVVETDVGLVESQEGIDRLRLAPDDGGSVAAGSGSAQSEGEDDRLGTSLSLESRWDSGEPADVLHSSDEFQSVQEVEAEQKEEFQVDGGDSMDSNSLPENVVRVVSDTTDVINEMHLSDLPQDSNASESAEKSALIDSTADVVKHGVVSPKDENAFQVEENTESPRYEVHVLETDSALENKDGEGNNLRRNSNEHIGDVLNQLENKRTSKKGGKKWLSSKKPLELAEELEKNHASSGLHWEEGAAAQPMRLEGIRRGPPAVGYLQIDPGNAITRMISSAAFRRDHGSAQVLAVHMNFIAVGMSRGAVLIVPSKYSIHYPDSMDAKMLVLGSQADHSPVTSMCFNQQGDLLLVGYSNGNVTVWDVLRASAVKIITEHSAPVVHTLFLGQEAQVTRQFKVVTGDCKGVVFLHAFSVVPLLNRFSIKSQCLLNGQNTGIVLSASALLIDDLHSTGLTSAQGNIGASPSSLGSMMGGVVGGVVGGEAGWKLFGEGSSFVEEGVVIFVTHQTVLVVRLVPSLEFYARLSKPSGVQEGSMPYTAWKCITYFRVLSADALEKASLLAIAWDRKLQIAKLVKSEAKSELKIQKEWTLDSGAIGVAWLDDQMLVVLTVRGQLFLFSNEGSEIHRTTFVVDDWRGDDIITYHTHFTNIDGNPEKAYHNSIAVRGATVYILGPTHLVVSRLLPWKERIQVLQKAGDWMAALDMAMRLYDGQAHGVIDLPRTIDAIREVIMPYLVELLLSYVDEVFSYISVAFCNKVGKTEESHEPSSCSLVHTQIQEQYARVGGVAVEFSVHIKRTDILFDDIFSKFVAVQQGGTFLELLEPYILKDMLGCLPPEIMQALVEHYSNKGWLQRVEQCVLHMDIASLDFNQVVRLCRENGLYGALIYLFNRGLDDFKAPLEELLTVIQNNQRMNAAAVGYRMLVYLKYCFLGLAFPPGHGTIHPSRLPLLRTELLHFLLENSNVQASQVAVRFTSSSEACPNLCYLLWLDTEATLEVLRCAFVDDEPLNSDQTTDNLADSSLNRDNESKSGNQENKSLMVQNTVNALIHILEVEHSEVGKSPVPEDNGSLEVWPSEKDIAYLLEFIACFVACKGAIVSKAVLNRILNYLTSHVDLAPAATNQKTEATQRKEKQVLAVLKVVPSQSWDSSHVLNLCEKAQFYQVCGFIHSIRGEYVAALDSYMKDMTEPVHAFVFINSLLLQLRGSESAFQSAVLSRIHELVTLSREATVFLVIDHFNMESHRILSELKFHPESLFLFLKTVIEVHLSGRLNFSSLGRTHLSDFPCGRKIKRQTDDLEAYMERISNFPKLLRHNAIQVTDEMAELYLELLCQYDRRSVLKFLETFENYRLEHCLRLCQEYGVTDAAAFLLERVGDVGSALLLILSDLDKKLDVLDAVLETRLHDIASGSLTEMHADFLTMKEIDDVRDMLHVSIGLCQRNTPRLDLQESESLWFRLLDSFCGPLRDLYDDKKVTKGRNHSKFDGVHILQKVFSDFIREIVEGMVGYVSLPTIMAKLLDDNGNQEFGDFKAPILGMLGIYSYERRILDTAKSLIEDDTYYTMSLLKKGASHAYAPQNLTCCICGCFLAKESSITSIRIFSCGHTMHVQCEYWENESSSREDSAGCPVCMPKKEKSRSKRKAVLLENGLIKSSSSRPQQAHGITSSQHLHEPDMIVEKPYGLQQMSRFELLSNLGKSQKSLQMETLPPLKLTPPAIYHEKVQKGTDLLRGENSNVVAKSEKTSKIRQPRDQKTKGTSSLRFPLKPSIFSTENRRR